MKSPEEIEEEVKDILIMYPDTEYTLEIVKNKRAVGKEFFRIYGVKKKYIGF